MLLKYIDALKCPICKASRIWKLDGDFTDNRMVTGKVICSNNHQWSVMEEVLRLDAENADEPMQLLDRPLTGFPAKVEEEVRGSFLTAFEQFVKDTVDSSKEPMILIGHPILFMKYIQTMDRDIIVVNEDERILRQVQDQAVKKRIYKQLSSIRAANIESLLPNAQIIYLFDNIPDSLLSNEIAVFCDRNPDADIIWEEGNSIFMKLVPHS